MEKLNQDLERPKTIDQIQKEIDNIGLQLEKLSNSKENPEILKIRIQILEDKFRSLQIQKERLENANSSIEVQQAAPFEILGGEKAFSRVVVTGLFKKIETKNDRANVMTSYKIDRTSDFTYSVQLVFGSKTETVFISDLGDHMNIQYNGKEENINLYERVRFGRNEHRMQRKKGPILVKIGDVSFVIKFYHR